MPVLLAIETSQRSGSVALRAAGGTIHVEHLVTARRHSDDLVPAIHRLCGRGDLRPRDITIVATSIGPGGFTGLRIAVSTTKMLAESLGANIVSVPSALVAAENFDSTAVSKPAREGDQIMVALASKRETYWGTRLRRSRGQWRFSDKPGLHNADAVARLIEDGLAAVLADEHFPESARSLCLKCGVPIVAPPLEAAACCRVAERLAAEGRFTDPLALMPIYPRPPEAVSLWEAREKNSGTFP